ncbi:trypsin-like serine peptidase [Streptomyces sp. NPDC013953]|uniref:trypsin-like serine peptidase n=1 Tax=Streptomyces sp. NPDC013953 TaxID=3364868 RepID=UPI00370175FD
MTAPAAAQPATNIQEPQLPEVISESVEDTTSQARSVRQHWTPERIKMALANPLKAPANNHSGDDIPAETPGATNLPEITASAEAVLPKNQDAQAVAHAAKAAAVPKAKDVAAPQAWPNRVVGKLLFQVPGQGDASCSATVIASKTKNAVWTAAHCLHKGSGGAKGFHKGFIFLPGYHEDTYPSGYWYHKRVIVPDTWAKSGDLRSSDMGALVMASGEPAYGNLQDEVGAWGYKFTTATDHADVHSLGYPSDGYGRPAKAFNYGSTMMYCRGKTIDAGNLNPLDNRLRLTCDMGHGSSGGPMAAAYGTGKPQIVGVNSHRDADKNGKWTKPYMYSSNHGKTAVAVIDLVNKG